MEVWRTSSWMSAHAIPGHFNAPGRAAHLGSIVARVVAARTAHRAFDAGDSFGKRVVRIDV
jgi:hypothetical protein